MVAVLACLVLSHDAYRVDVRDDLRKGSKDLRCVYVLGAIKLCASEGLAHWLTSLLTRC